MRYRKFGDTGLMVSELGIGGSHFGSMVNQSSKNEINNTLRQALEQGVNFYDTADIYGQGESERIIGRVFSGHRDKVIIASKAGFCLSRTGKVASIVKPLIKPLLNVAKPFRKSLLQARSSQIQQDFSGNYLIQSVESSLKRLKTDYIDLFQLHEPPTEAILNEAVLAALEKMKAQGKIRFYGVACGSVEDAVLSLTHPEFSSVQVELNLCNQSAIKAVLPQVRAQAVGVIARQPFASGKLFERYRDSSLGIETTSEQIVQAALQSVLRFDAVSVVIAGMRSRAHLSKNLAALETPLSTKKLAAIEVAFASMPEEVLCC